MNLIVLCDFDGTITQIDTAEYVLGKFAQGDWRAFDEQFEKGMISLEECLRFEFSLVEASKRQILNELKSVVTFRPHFEEFAMYCRKNGFPLEIVSAGLDFVIDHFLKLKGWQNLVVVHAPKTRFGTNGIEFTFPKLVDKTSVNFKHDLVKQYRNSRKEVAYIGDGSGDYAAAKDSDCCFAVEGSRLARLCEKNNTHCVSITDFQEVLLAIQEMNVRSESERE